MSFFFEFFLNALLPYLKAGEVPSLSLRLHLSFLYFAKLCRWLLSKLDSSGRLADEIETCEELMSEEMELTPLESKWPTLTLLRIVLKLKNSKLSEKAAAHDVEDLLKKLQEFDPDRKNYYASVNIT